MSNRFRLRFTFWLDMLKEGEAAVADAIDKLKTERLFAQTVRDGIKLIMSLRDGKMDVLFEMFPWVRAEFLEYMRELQSIPPTETEPQALQEQIESARVFKNPDTQAERAWLEAEQERIEQERAWEQRRTEEAQKALEAERQSIELERQRIEAERQQNQSTIQKQLDRLEQMLLQQGNIPVQSASPPNGSGVGLKGLNQGGVGLKGGNSSTNFAPPPVFDDDDIPEMTITKSKSGKTAAQNLINGLLGLQQ